MAWHAAHLPQSQVSIIGVLGRYQLCVSSDTNPVLGGGVEVGRSVGWRLGLWVMGRV
jgi:hypothetical protein